MADQPQKRILILTAAFGEGHNSAAQNLARALEECGAIARVADPCMLAAPVTTRWLCRGYRYLTTHWPQIWHRVYLSTDQVDFSRQRMPLMRKPERHLGKLLRDFQPDAVVSTYPLYPYFLKRLFEDEGIPKVPVYTIITDSIEINSSWLKAPTDAWLVTDPHTRDVLVKSGLNPSSIWDTGFPVHPEFSRLQPVAKGAECEPFTVLYFPTAKRPHVRRTGRAILNASPHTRLTIVLGKNVRLLGDKARELRRDYPGRVKLIGWTKRVPMLMNRHHLIIGKAGGATVHEAIAARCPMLIHHLVPGQEEGNLKLLQQLGAGRLAEEPASIDAALRDLLSDNAALWRQMKQRLCSHDRCAGGLTTARAILRDLA